MMLPPSALTPGAPLEYERLARPLDICRIFGSFPIVMLAISVKHPRRTADSRGEAPVQSACAECYNIDMERQGRHDRHEGTVSRRLLRGLADILVSREQRLMDLSDSSSALLDAYEAPAELWEADLEAPEPTAEDLETVEAVRAALARRPHVDWSRTTELAPPGSAGQS
jgi:hypothetical protein